MCALNPRKIKKLLRNIGGIDLSSLKLEEMNNVVRVELVLSDGSRIVIDNPTVAKMNIANFIVFQIQTTATSIRQEKPAQATAQPSATAPQVDIIQQPAQAVKAEPKPKYTEEDIELVMQEAGCSREEAIRALEETNGDIAEAILLIKSRKEKS